MGRICPHCGMYENQQDVFYCVKDNYRLIPWTEDAAQEISNKLRNEKNQQLQPLSVKNIPKCPTCSSTNIERISTASKVVGAAMFGLLSTTARSQFECRNCGYKW